MFKKEGPANPRTLLLAPVPSSASRIPPSLSKITGVYPRGSAESKIG